MSENPNPKCSYEVLAPGTDGEDVQPCGAPAVYWGDADHEKAFCTEHAQILHGDLKDEHLDKVVDVEPDSVLYRVRRLIDVQADDIKTFYNGTDPYSFESIERAGAYNALVNLRSEMTPEGIKVNEKWQGPEATELIYPPRDVRKDPTEAQLNEAGRTIAKNLQAIVERSGLTLDQVVNVLERTILDIKREKVVDQKHGS